MSHVLEGRDNLAVDPVQPEENCSSAELKIPRIHQETNAKVFPVRNRQSQTDGLASTLYKTL